MIDTDNLRTASLYINNQLLSRGLLKDGQSIDFADTVMGGSDSANTMGRIMTVVNDLILRRDRDAEHRESLSTTMRALRADNLKLTNDTTRLTEKNSEAQRKLDIAESSEAALKTQLKSADAAIRGLKDDLTRTKALVAQARATCANDVRRRDRQIDTLKKQLGEAGRARGSRNNSAITTINVTGDFGAEKGAPSGRASTADEEYSLRNETNAFLAKLAQDLSEENESILNSMQRAMDRLRQMSGWNNDNKTDGQVIKSPSWQDMSTELDSVLDHMTTILTNPSFVPLEEVEIREEEINRLKDGWVKMESRWKEAVVLIDGWRKRMAASGRPVCDEELEMGLRLSPVRVPEVAETRQARGFGLSAVVEEEDIEIEPIQQSPCPGAGQSLDLVPEPDHRGFQDSYGRSSGDGSIEEDMNDYDEQEEPNVEILQKSEAASANLEPTRSSSPIPEAPQLSPLRQSPSAGNRQALQPEKQRKRAVEFSTIVEENSRDLSQATTRHPSPRKGTLPRPKSSRERLISPSRKTSLEEALLSPRREEMAPEPLEEEENEPPEIYDDSDDDQDELAAPPQKTPRRGTSKLPVPRNADVTAAQQSPLTMANIAAKLAASEREADAARVRAKLKAVRGAQRPSMAGPQRQPDSTQTSRAVSSANAHEVDHDGDMDPVKQDPAPTEEPQKREAKPEKRKRDRRTSKAASRRRSTLSPWELDSLISGNVQ